MVGFDTTNMNSVYDNLYQYNEKKREKGLEQDRNLIESQVDSCIIENYNKQTNKRKTGSMIPNERRKSRNIR